MYSYGVKPPKWQLMPVAPYRRSNSRRRIYIVISVTVCFLFWHAMKQPISWDMDGAEDAGASSISSRILPKDLRLDTYHTSAGLLRKDSDSIEGLPPPLPRKKLVEEGPIETSVEAMDGSIKLHQQPQQAQQPIVPPDVQDPIQITSEVVTDRIETNQTPEEEDDGEETALAGLAVASKGKEPPTGVKQASDKMQQQHLGPAAIDDSVEQSKLKEIARGAERRTSFPQYSDYVAQDTMADALPDVIHIPFEDTTADVVLQGWEDVWFSRGEFEVEKWGKLEEPKIDFVYTWVNGSEKAFTDTIYPYELNSTLNDPEGKWLLSHRVNRYRDWDELRYSIRTVEKYAQAFRNKIQILVNAVGPEDMSALATPQNPSIITGKQTPLWLNDNEQTADTVQILAQEDFFDESEQGCLPTFNSLTIENQIHNTPSTVDRLFALSDDMLLGKPHAASDLYSPLFGPTMGFKSNSYNTKEPPTDLDARRFGEKPYLIYTSWLLNRRFGERKRKGQVHFGHSMSRSVTREAIKSFPRPALQSTCQRFRGETGFQLYSWYVAFHYTIERQREALLWSYIMQRTDTDQDGNLGWPERQAIMADLEEGMANEGNTTYRTRLFYQVAESLESAGLEAPKVNLDILWTSLDGPATIRDIECYEFNVNECLAPGFSTHSSDEHHTNPVFSTASILDHVARQHPKCGDCLMKLILNRVEKGLAPLLPHAESQAEARATVVKALLKYQYTVIEPDALFVMVTDAEQVKNVLLKRLVYGKREVGQLCLNDDVASEEEHAINALRKAMSKLLKGMAPTASSFEKD